MTINEIDNFNEEVIKVIKNWFKTSGFRDRKLTDTPTDDLQVANKAYVDSVGNPAFSGTVQLLVVAGGGGGGVGGGGTYGGGGSGGGVQTVVAFPVSAFSGINQPYTVTVGNGGNANTNGNQSIFHSVTAGAGTLGSSNAGGGVGGIAPTGGGNGGAGNSVGVGVDGSNGTLSSISGSSLFYGSGAGGAGNPTGGVGGANGGGHGSDSSANFGTNGTANTGGGGGGNITDSGNAIGGKGVVIVSYVTANFGPCTGGTITTNGVNTVHTFNSNGTFTVVAK